MPRDPVMDDELSDFIVKRLAGGSSEQDVILEVCQRAGLTWPEAQSLVYGAMDNRATDIARWQLPVLLVLGLATVLAGVGIIARFVLVVAAPMRGIAGQGDVPISPENLNLLFWAIANAQFAGDLALGGAMIVGGGLGLYAAVNKAMGS